MLKSLMLFLVLIYIFSFLCCCKDNPENFITEDESEEISWWCSNRASSFGIDMDELPVFSELQECTGMKIDFIHPPSGQYKLRFQLMLASGRLPDIISHDFLNDYPGGVSGAIYDKVILPIDDELLQHAPNLKRYLNANPEFAEQLKIPDGRYFCVPSLNPDERSSTYMGPFIRKDLLEKHGLDLPVTFSDWEEVLTVLASEPGVNAPLTFYGGNIKKTRFLIGSFGIDWGFYIKDGHVEFGAAEPEFYEFISLFRRWYRKGWIDSGVLYNSRRAYLRIVENDTFGIYVDYISNLMSYERILKKKIPSAELVPLNYPRTARDAPAPPGHREEFFIPFAAAYITTSAEEPEKVIQMLDYAWSDEGLRLFNYGIENKSYFLKDGKPVFADEIFSTEEKDSYKKFIVSGPYLKDTEAFYQSLRLKSQQDAVSLWQGRDSSVKPLPFLITGREDSRRLMDIRKRLEDHVNDTVIDIISGKKELAELENLNAELKAIGLDEAIYIYENLYHIR